MSVKKTLESRFLDKIVSVYTRLHEENRDENEILRLTDVFIRKALGKIGFSGTAEKLEARAKQLAALAVERGRAELERKQFLLELKIGKGSNGYSVGFLPGVRIPNTPQHHTAWCEFMGTLAAKTRIGPDPETGEIGILYRDGAWLGDMMLADDVRSLSILPDIGHIRGSLTARGARVVNKTFTHKVCVDGDLFIHLDLLRQDPPDLHFSGDMGIYGLKSPLDTAFSPERFMAWGLKHGQGLTLRSDHFTLQIKKKLTGPQYMLRGENVLSNFLWQKDKWIKTIQERLPKETFEAVHSKLSRLCLKLGLGTDFIAKSISRVPNNIDRIALYLEFALQYAAGTAPCKKDPESEATQRTLTALFALRPLFTEKRINPEAVEQALAALRDEDHELIAALAARPRPKHSEKLVQADLDAVTSILDQEVDSETLLTDGLGTARALHLAFCSPEMQANLMQALTPLNKALEATLTVTSLVDPPSLTALLDDPGCVLKSLTEAARTHGAKGGTAALEAELRELRNLRPKEMVRRVANVPFSVDTEEFQADKTLLRDLFEMPRTELAKLPFDAMAMLAFIVPDLSCVAAPRLRLVLESLTSSNTLQDALADALIKDLELLPPDKLVSALRNWIRLHLEVVRKFNELGTIDYGGSRETEREEKERAMIALPPEVTREITARLDRLCLLSGLGRTFIDHGSTALEPNLRKCEHYLALALGTVPGAPESRLQAQDKRRAETALEALCNLRHSLETADAEAARKSMKQLSDPALTALTVALTKPRDPGDITALKQDLSYLDGLKDTRLTIERVFLSSGKFLLFANSCLESKEMKKTVSVYIKPLYFGLTRLGKDSAGVTTNDLLHNACIPDKLLNGMAQSSDASAQTQIREALDKICSKSIADIVSELRKAGSGESQGELERDREFMGRVLALKGTALGTLQLDEKRMALLLMVTLDSHLKNWSKTSFESGRFSGKTSKYIVSMVHERAKWEYEIMRTYNKLTTKPD